MTNVGELDQIRTFLRDHPDLYRQRTLYDATGTRGCLAAWTDALNRGCRAGDRIVAPAGHVMGTLDRARGFLGLTGDEACEVFIARSGARGNDVTLRLVDALIARDKGVASAADVAKLRRYGLPTEPAGDAS